MPGENGLADLNPQQFSLAATPGANLNSPYGVNKFPPHTQQQYMSSYGAALFDEPFMAPELKSEHGIQQKPGDLNPNTTNQASMYSYGYPRPYYGNDNFINRPLDMGSRPIDMNSQNASFSIGNRISDLRTTIVPESATAATLDPELTQRDKDAAAAAAAAATAGEVPTDPDLDPGNGRPDNSVRKDSSGSTPDLISWLFSDAMILNAKEPLLSPSFYSFDSPVSLQSLLSPPVAQEEIVMSETKRMEILAAIPLLETHEDSNLLMLQNFISKYWTFFHPQYPILHKPSFQADNCPPGLLWAIICLGAAFDKADDFAAKIADHLRWLIFGSPDFSPPAKLWVIQSLVLLEIFEKTMTSRKLHERAHIHHGTTLQLVRRGSALFGEENNIDKDPWKRWVDVEATKRAALMAFILDVFDAAMFGHSLVMSIHEIRISLPCNESLWSEYPSEKGIPKSQNQPFLVELKKILNKTPVETGPLGRRVLLAGLLCISLQMQQRDLQVTSVGWGAFRNTWRDILSPAFDFWKKDYDRSVREGYRKRLENDLENEGTQEHHDEDHTKRVGLNGYAYLLETQGCTSPFYHLGHILMHTSILDFQIFAGCPTILNHKIKKADRENGSRKVRDLVFSTGGRQAWWHAIRFLREMFMSSQHEAPTKTDNFTDSALEEYSTCSSFYPFSKSVTASNAATPIDSTLSSTSNGAGTTSRPEALEDMVEVFYEGSSDPISKRPYMIYLCTLVVWAFGFCQDGPEINTLSTKESYERLSSEELTVDEIAEEFLAKTKDLPQKESGHEYLFRMSNFRYSELQSAPGRNQVVGLLRLVIQALDNCSWEVIQEGRKLLIHCLMKSLGSKRPECDYMFKPRVR